MSRYNFDKDFKPDVVKKELEKMLKVEKTGSKSHIVFNEQWDDSEKSNSKVKGSSKNYFLLFILNKYEFLSRFR